MIVIEEVSEKWVMLSTRKCMQSI